MSGSRLLRLYPPAWRARYGEELEALMADSGGGRRESWDVALAAGRERLRAAGLAGDGLPPRERVRAGSLLVLCAWALVVVAGVGVQKLSEQWQATAPAGTRGLADAAFRGLVGAAAVGTVLVLAGIAAALPALAGFLRRGGWAQIRRTVLTAVLLSVVTVAAGSGLIAWAHRLTVAQRNGHDVAYEIAFAVCALLVCACLGAWTAAAVAVASRLSLTPATLRVEAGLAAGVAVAIGAIAVATAVFWTALAPSVPRLVAGPAALMLVATVLAALGAARALRALPALSD